MHLLWLDICNKLPTVMIHVRIPFASTKRRRFVLNHQYSECKLEEAFSFVLITTAAYVNRLAQLACRFPKENKGVVQT